jgi:hypothetical protein
MSQPQCRQQTSCCGLLRLHQTSHDGQTGGVCYAEITMNSILGCGTEKHCNQTVGIKWDPGSFGAYHSAAGSVCLVSSPLSLPSISETE